MVGGPFGMKAVMGVVVLLTQIPVFAAVGGGPEVLVTAVGEELLGDLGDAGGVGPVRLRLLYFLLKVDDGVEDAGGGLLVEVSFLVELPEDVAGIPAGLFH